MPHIHQEFDFVISVFIVYEGKVLLVHHPRYDKWLPMGGHVELNEDPEQALFREVNEETSLEIEVLAQKPMIKQSDTKFIFAPRYIDVHEANSPHRHIALVYFARAKNNKYVLSAEHTEINWVGSSDIDNPKYSLSDSIKFYCKAAIDTARTYKITESGY
jgi:ADP-ribose pyrophosphatase YjhB (NUDIX family)